MSTPPGTASPPVPRVVPAPGSRLEQLLFLRQSARDDVRAIRDVLKTAEERLKMINDGIEAEAYRPVAGQLGYLVPSESRIEIAGSPSWPALRMLWVAPVRLNSKALKEKDRATWDKWAERGKGYWDLRPDGESESAA